MQKETFRMYKGIKIEYIYNGTQREYQTSFRNIGRYSTLKKIKEIITKTIKIYE